MFEHSAITDQGKALMAACIAAGHAIEFTAYTLGSGTYTDAEKTVAQLKTRQSLKVQKQSFSFTSARSEGAEAILKVQVDNDGLAAGYYMTEAGIWAKDATDNDTPAILYQIGVDDTPSYMPDEDTSPLTIDTECHTVIDNDAEVTFTFTHGAYAWADELGDITQLSTTNKDSAVDAINELDSDLGDIEDKFDLDGNLKISHGGTQASNGDDALVNLGAISQHAVSICNWPEEAAFNFRGGRYFYHQLKYYRATKNISAGDTLVPTGAGANCEEVDLADEIERKASIKAITDNSEYDFKCTKAAGYDIDDLVYIECADQLYKVTAAILQNESMSTSSNIKKWSVEDETSELNSHLTDLNYSGKTVAFSESVICPAYVSASGNYVAFVVPLNVVASKTYTVTVSDITFFKPTGGRLTWSSDFDQTYKDVKKLAASGLKIELKFSSTQSAFISFPAVVTFSGSIAVS